MTKEKLQEYPFVNDPMDFGAPGVNSKCFDYGIGEIKMTSGETLVYLVQQRENPEIVDTPIGPRGMCEQGIVICGYKRKGFLRSPRIKTIQDAERESVESELLQKLKGKKPNYIEFW